MINVVCKCGFSFQAQDAARGRQMECLQCRAPLVVGGDAAPARTAVPRVEVERRIGADTVVVRCAEKLSNAANALLDTYARVGPPKTGAVVYYGPTPVFLHPEGPGRFRVCEPDLRLPDARSRPEPDLSNVLALAVLSATLHRAIGVLPTDLDMFDGLLVFRNALDERRVFLHRKQARTRVSEKAIDSGWFLGPDPERWARMSDAESAQKTNYRMVPMFELYYRRPALLAALCLPVEFIAHADGNQLLRVHDATDRVVWQFDPAAPAG